MLLNPSFHEERLVLINVPFYPKPMDGRNIPVRPLQLLARILLQTLMGLRSSLRRIELLLVNCCFGIVCGVPSSQDLLFSLIVAEVPRRKFLFE
jgi:hypothetical protein